MNFFDHADIYGNGKCEELFGQALAKHPEWREQMMIQTKCGIVRKQRYDFSKEHILSCVNESLKRLQVDYIDIVLLHRPMPYVIQKKWHKLSISLSMKEK
nr:aldo/keto reductase [Kandleria vitulina]